MILFATPKPLDPARQASLSSNADLLAKFEEVSSLRFQQSADTRGYLAMQAELQGLPTAFDKLHALAKELAPQNKDAVTFSAIVAPEITRERSLRWMRKLLESLPLLSLERFRLKVLNLSLEHNPDSISTPVLAQTIFRAASKVSSVKAAIVASDLFISAKMQKDSDLE